MTTKVTQLWKAHRSSVISRPLRTYHLHLRHKVRASCLPLTLIITYCEAVLSLPPLLTKQTDGVCLVECLKMMSGLKSFSFLHVCNLLDLWFLIWRLITWKHYTEAKSVSRSILKFNLLILELQKTFIRSSFPWESNHNLGVSSTYWVLEIQDCSYEIFLPKSWYDSHFTWF